MLVHYSDTSPFSRAPNLERLPGRPCAHCRRRCGTWAGGYARLWGRPVCYHPHEPDRPDCYTHVLVAGHPLIDCPRCLNPDTSVAYVRQAP